MTRQVFSIVPLVVVAAIGCHRHHPDGPAHSQASDEPPRQSVTVWTDKSELFMEYPALIVGRPSSFAAHITILNGWKPLTAGRVMLTVKMANGQPLTGEAPAPTRPGIFEPVLKPISAGKCTFVVSIEGPHTDRIEAAPCEVYARAEAARAEGGKESRAGAISYLKEQQWATQFETDPAGERDLQPTVRLNGEIKPVAGKEARLAAAAGGRIEFATPAPVLGSPIRKGQVLARLLPRLPGGADRASLEADVQAARAQAQSAEAQRSRAERLLLEDAVPKKMVEEARAAAEVAGARLAAAQGRRAQQDATARGIGGGAGSAFQVRAPIAGTLTSVHVASGETVEEGALLFVVVDLANVWLEARVFEPDIPRVDGATTGWFSLEGYERPFAFGPEDARLITLGRVLDPRTRTVPLIFELRNDRGTLRIGQFAKIDVASGSPVRLVAVPASAIVDEAGKPVVYVQLSGESFERRPVASALRSGSWVGVRAGVRAGERVVSKGAYEVKLASSTGSLPTQGHSH